MYLSSRAALVRNVAAAAVNGTITLILLLIAPLGLAAVIANTILVTASTFFVGAFGDFVVAWLMNYPSLNRLERGWERRDITPFRQTRAIDRRRR